MVKVHEVDMVRCSNYNPEDEDDDWIEELFFYDMIDEA